MAIFTSLAQRSKSLRSHGPFSVMALGLALELGISHSAAFGAEEYPIRPVQMVVPFSAGGPADIIARLYGQHLSRLLGQSIVIENRDGAAGIIGTQAVARSTPDGYSILFGTTSIMAVNQAVMKNIPYDFARDFYLIGLIAYAPHVLAVRDSLPANSAPELIALARKSPGKFTFASSGTGTIVQMGGELFKYESGINILHVPYKGGNAATLALLSGQVDMTVNDLTTLKANFVSGKLRPLAVAYTNRLKLIPDTPTFQELGLPKIVSSTWWGIAVPAKVPEAVKLRLKEANNKIISDSDYVARLASMAVEPLLLTQEQSAAFIAGEIQKWKKVADAADIRLE